MKYATSKAARVIGKAAIVAAATLMATGPAMAQFSDSYNFLKGVRDADGTEVTKALDKSANGIINTRDYSTGESALHITVKRRDMTWTTFMLAKGANPNVKDQQGETPLMAATRVGFIEGANLLIERGAQVDLANGNGETPLIVATQARNVPMVRILLTAGADPKKGDRISGKSALDYATSDPRAAAVLKVLQEAPAAAKPKPKIAGPGL
ncbi:ankyrin repeat domain-containing protein [Sphingomonas crocodyli]|uniref:Ankyrin repeat domain-containing protein n=1 Tax=Sphingomonas crocodyli TaxID=1979270 RepID=A0A437M4F4_9SPHN|nr:ankyrin repeat domain-containing protein [Sphingomonas crocodyli]RVT92600.1 ankyrin repeat domain-containing protein [Sphingomonas crocodyli]